MTVTTAIPLSEGLAVFPILSSGLNEPLLSFAKIGCGSNTALSFNFGIVCQPLEYVTFTRDQSLWYKRVVTSFSKTKTYSPK